MIALGLYLVERISALASGQPPAGLIMAVVLTLVMIGGVRGTFAHRRLKEAENPIAAAAAAGKTIG